MTVAWSTSRTRLLALTHQPVAAAVLLLAAYVGLSFGMSTGGYLGTDTGAKVATLEVMKEQDTERPFLGYWAEQWDPEGTLHPILGAEPVDGDWVHVTTLPMLELGRPLYELGGYRLTLLLPMLGAIGAAFAGRSIARRAAGDRAGWLAYWTIGLLSPMAVYALDFWEHSVGVACMAGAIALLAGIVDGEPPFVRAVGAGLLLGTSATMRTESFAYAAVAVGLCAVILLVHHRSPRPPITVGLLALAGFAAPWLLNRQLEISLGGNSRTARATGTAGAGLDRLGDRATEAVTTLLALRPDRLAVVVVVGGALAAVLVLAVVLSSRRDPSIVRLLLALAGLLHLVALAGGLGFVPGMVAAAPIVVAAVLLRPSERSARFALAVAVGALPVVWAFQYVGGAFPQWAGRYALTSCIVLVALGCVALTRATRELRLGLLALSAMVTLSGVLWLGDRSHGMDRLFDQLVDRPEDVVVVRNGFFVREGGAAYTERLWLSAVSDDDLDRAVEVVGDSGHRTFAVLDERPDAPEEINGAILAGTDRTSVVNVALYLHSYEIP
jgi:hypothetical protein